MTAARPRALHRLPAALASILLCACGGAAFHMRPAVSEALPAPSADRALVVFVMPEAGRVPLTVFDEMGVYFGQLRGRTWFAREVTPGEHRFYVVRNVSGHVVHAEGLVAGRTYYVVAEDPLVARFVWRALRCDEDGEALRRAAVHVEPDPRVPEADVRASIGDEPMRMHEADQRWDALSASDAALATVRNCEPVPAAPVPAASEGAAPATPSTDGPAAPATGG